MDFRGYVLLSTASLFLLPTAAPQTTPIAASAPTAVPSLVSYSGVVATQGKPEPATITFQVFKEETAGEPLWTETQSVQIDPTGHYKVQLGATNPNGLPSNLFTTGEARWLEVQIAGQTPQPRILLASVPYALKAGDATTLNGLPASAYALAAANPPTVLAVPAGITPDANAAVTTPGGTTGYLPVFTGTATIADSILYASSTGIGVGDVPNSTAVFDVNGKSIWRGLLNVSRQGTATAKTGYNSYPMLFQASSYDSTITTSTLPQFQLQAEPSGLNSANPGATFNLLYNNNGGTPAETGFHFNGNGTINFASGQTFPGTITKVTAGTDLTGTVSGGVVTLNLNTAATNTIYPQLAANNTFTGTQSFTKVGIGTTTPRSLLEIQAAVSEGLGPVATLTNTLGGAGAESALDFNTDKPSTTGTYNPMARIVAHDDAGMHYSDDLLFQSNTPGKQNNGLQTNMVIASSGLVGIGFNPATNPSDYQLTVRGANGAEGGIGGGIYSASGSSSYISAGVFDGNALDATGVADGIDAYAGGGSYAGDFDGNVAITGTLNGSTPEVVRIDHPLDAANKYLSHAAVQSSELMDIYSGNVTTDELGLATVTLPDWFQAENTDFRYQLTVIGGRFAQAIVSKEIANNKFTISTNASNVKVSWQVTAVRQDAYAKAHPLVVEQDKPANEQGFYIQPNLFGQPAEKQTQWGRHPKQMQNIKAMREARKSAAISPTAQRNFLAESKKPAATPQP
jgi:hypothetical protein